MLADYLIGGTGNTLVNKTVEIPSENFTRLVLEFLPTDNSRFVYKPNGELRAHLEIDLVFQANNSDVALLGSGAAFTSVELINATLVASNVPYETDPLWFTSARHASAISLPKHLRMGGSSQVLASAFEFSGLRVSLNIPTNKQFGDTSLTLQPGSYVRFVRTVDTPWQQNRRTTISDMDGFLQVVDEVKPTFGTSCPDDISVPTFPGVNHTDVSWTTPEATDNRNIAVLRSTFEPGNRFVYYSCYLYRLR
jgi:hypothetical protein